MARLCEAVDMVADTQKSAAAPIEQYNVSGRSLTMSRVACSGMPT